MDEESAAAKHGLSTSAVRLIRGLIPREHDDAQSKDLHAHLLKTMFKDFPLHRVIDLEHSYNLLNTDAKRFASDAIVGWANFPFANMGNHPEVVVSTLLASATAAPVFSERYCGISYSATKAEKIGIAVSIGIGVSREEIRWNDPRVVDYTLGVAILAAANRSQEDVTDENVIWLGQNSEKLKHLVERISEVSADPEYLQPLLESVPKPLAEGAL